jgi:cell wall-associated NlpC family hydrolase
MKRLYYRTCFLFIIALLPVLPGCMNETNGTPAEITEKNSNNSSADTVMPVPLPAKTDSLPKQDHKLVTDTGIVRPDSLVAFARTLLGIQYLYASTDPAKGFDCSGFITYVFNHFKITVPRSSVNFTNYGKTISLNTARPGDLVLFTGTDSTIRTVGHMGIVESIKNDTLRFIHSSSGKANGVVISPLGNYYRGRFVKVIRVFADELFR